MIHYHGTPVGGKTEDATRFLAGRHAFVSFADQRDIATAADVCQSFALDNGAFSFWRANKAQEDWSGYYRWVEDWYHHPGFDWAIIPDVIDGTEEANDELVDEWPYGRHGVPVWHLHESTERLQRLAAQWHRVALGSSGQWSQPGSEGWWWRMDEAMQAVCMSTGGPQCKLHGLRMLAPDVFSRLPLSSADSTNAARNAGSISRFGQYVAPHKSQRAEAIANRIEAINSAAIWLPYESQQYMMFGGDSDSP